jgi:hypothetical protein
MAKKPRPSVRREIPTDDPDRILIEDVVHPGEWRFRERLVEYDRQNQRGGQWVAVIDAVFDDVWFRAQTDLAHDVAKSMCWDWSLSTRNIADVADLVCAVGHGGDGAASVLKRLRVHEQFTGASFEARVARLLHEAGLGFEFVPAKGDGKALDLTVHGPMPFVVEVKSRERSLRAIALDAVLHEAFFRMASMLGGATLDVDFSGAEALEAPTEVLFASIDEHAHRIVTTVALALAASPESDAVEVSVQGLGVATVTRYATTPDTAYAGNATDPTREADRFARTVGKASQQLTQALPSVVVLCAEAGAVDKEHAPAAIARFLHDKGASFPQVSGVIVLVATSAYAIVEETWPVANPHAEVPLGALPLPEARNATRRERGPLDEPFQPISTTGQYKF